MLPLFLLLAAVFIFAISLAQRKWGSGANVAVKPLLTKRESAVGAKLEGLLRERPDLRLCPKVRVCDILEISSAGERRKSFGRHVDFTITRAGDMVPVLCIEVNDASHDALVRRRRDSEMAMLFGRSGVRLLFLRSEKELSYPSLRALLQEIPLTT